MLNWHLIERKNMESKILVDTNVLLDYFLTREPFFNDAKQIIEKCAEGKINACIAAHSVSIARPENNAKNSAPQSVNYCVTDFRRTPVRLQICSLQFALSSTAFFALFSGLAIVPPANAPSPSAVLPGG